MEITNRDLINAVPTLRRINQDGLLPARPAVRFGRMMKQVQGQLAIIQEATRKIAGELAQKDEDGLPVQDSEGNLVLDDESRKLYEAQLEEMLDDSSGYSGPPLTYELLDSSGLAFSPADGASLAPFIVDKE